MPDSPNHLRIDRMAYDGDACESLSDSIVDVFGVLRNGYAAWISRPTRLMGFDERQVYVAVNDPTSAVVLLSLRHLFYLCGCVSMFDCRCDGVVKIWFEPSRCRSAAGKDEKSRE